MTCRYFRDLFLNRKFGHYGTPEAIRFESNKRAEIVFSEVIAFVPMPPVQDEYIVEEPFVESLVQKVIEQNDLAMYMGTGN